MEEKLPQRNSHVLIMAFGLPIMTTAIVMGSMYAGHLITQTSDRPAEVRVQTAPPKIDITVPQAPVPNINVASSAPKVDVHLPQLAPPTVTVNAPTQPPPNITVNPPAPTVTIIDRRESEKPSALAEVSKPAAAKSESQLATTEKPTSAPASPALPAEKPAQSVPAKPSSEAARITKPETHAAAPLTARNDNDGLKDEPTLDNLYAYATRYIDMYCKQRGLDSANEARRWNRVWQSNVDQAIADNIDSSEQSYINRVVITKRDYFNLNTASPDKIVEACRILLRYRDGQLAWLQAMKDALTNENLKKTMAFLAQGPR